MENKMLSIVVPVYNAGKYLEECIKSLSMQSLPEMEIIFVNDCSPCENDEVIINKYMKQDSRIKYIKHNQNKGAAGAINTGLEISTGKYFTAVGNDDYILGIDTYKNLIQKAVKNNVDVLAFGAYSFVDGKDDEKTPIYRTSYYKKIRKINVNHFPSEVTWNKLFKLDTIKNNNLKFNENAKYEDIEFWYRYVITVDPIIKYVDENYYMYRQRENSVMSTNTNFNKRFEVYKMIYEFIKKNNKEQEYRKNIVKWLSIPENFNTYPDEVKNNYRKNAIDFMQEIDLKSEEIFDILDMQFFRMFINDEYAAAKYMEVINNYKKIKYKYEAPNIFLYKLKREIKRIFSKIK